MTKFRFLAVATVLFGCTMFASNTAQAQVNVGLNEDALPGTILQLKETPGVADGSQNANRGLAFPRVALSDVNQLLPMLSGDSDYTGGNVSAKNAQYTGLVVYNVTNDASKGLYPGLVQWDGSKWVALSQSGGIGNAIFAVLTCQDVTVNGNYVKGMPTNSQNSMTLTLNVTTPGAYTITVQSGNGYSFYTSGIALNPGALTVTLPAQGTPNNSGTDNLTLSGIALASGCTPTNTVSTPIANYSMNCATVIANGTYLKGTALTPSNTITLSVSVSVQGSYYISTPVTNGISFTYSGSWDASAEGTTQTVTLVGSGTPTVNLDFPITINANTLQGTATCSTTIPVTAPNMTYCVIGTTWDWTWNDPPRVQALGLPANFGPNGLVKVSGLIGYSYLNTNTGPGTAIDYITNGMSGVYPDFVLYFAYGIEPTPAMVTALTNYVKAGGCLIYGGAADDGQSAINNFNLLLTNLFGASAPVAIAQVAGTQANDNDYQIRDMQDDPIINGPFGNLAGGGYYWGEDNASTGSLILPTLPPQSVQICSAYNPDGKPTVSPASSIVWYNTNYNIVYFGDCVGASTGSSTDTGSYPAYYPNPGVPTSKLYGPSGYNHYVSNSQLELNAVAWAIKRALTNGINPH